MYKLECNVTYIRNIHHEFIRKRGSLTKFGLIGNNVMYYLNISYVICHVIILNFRLKLVKNNTIIKANSALTRYSVNVFILIIYSL